MVIRNNSGQLITNQTVGMQISILQGSPTGIPETFARSRDRRGGESSEQDTGLLICGEEGRFVSGGFRTSLDIGIKFGYYV